MSDCPSPLEWHPWYRGKAWLIDWLNDAAPNLPKHDLLIPIARPMKAVFEENPSPIGPSFNAIRLTKQRAWGPAPWVGRPFHYEWNVATDTLGRSIAGESRIIYDQMYAGMPAKWWHLMQRNATP